MFYVAIGVSVLVVLALGGMLVAHLADEAEARRAEEARVTAERRARREALMDAYVNAKSYTEARRLAAALMLENLR